MSLLFLKYKKVAFVLHPMNYKTLDIFVVLQTSKLDLDLLKIILYSILTISNSSDAGQRPLSYISKRVGTLYYCRYKD
jgi:hypothetical protein